MAFLCSGVVLRALLLRSFVKLDLFASHFVRGLGVFCVGGLMSACDFPVNAVGLPQLSWWASVVDSGTSTSVSSGNSTSMPSARWSRAVQ
jgi:hypothetical protein